MGHLFLESNRGRPHARRTGERAERAAGDTAQAETSGASRTKALTAAEVGAIVDGVIGDLTADGTGLTMRQLGLVMKPVTEKVAGRFDGKAVSEIVRSRIPQ